MKRLAVFMMTIICFGSVFADSNKSNDERQKRWEEMKAKRAAFFTERICFTENEAQQFWPVYNKLQEEKGKLNSRMRNLHRNPKKNDKGENMPDFKKITEEMINIRVQEANLDKTYYHKFKNILPPEKLFRFYIAERDWGGELLKQIEKRGR